MALETLLKKMSKMRKKNITIISNPEFLREGEAIRDFRFPDRIVIGSNEKKHFQTLKKFINH